MDNLVGQLVELREVIRRAYRHNLKHNRDIEIDADMAVALIILDPLIEELNGSEDTQRTGG